MAGESVLGSVKQSVLRRWLEVLLPLYTLATLLVWFHPEYMPSVLGQGVVESPVVWVAWALVGAMSGILILWAIIVGFFLLYSPLYLVGKLPRLVGKGPWADSREMQFYGWCFVLLGALAGIMVWDARTGLVAFVTVAGCGPVFWRWLV